MTVEMNNVLSGADSCSLAHNNMSNPSPKVFPPARNNPGNLQLRRVLKPGDPNYQPNQSGTVEELNSVADAVHPGLLLTSPEMEMTSPDMELPSASDAEMSSRMSQLQISRESSPIPHLIICEEADDEDFNLDEDCADDCEYGGGYREADAISVSDYMEGASLSRSSSSLSVPPVDIIDEGKRPPHLEGVEDVEPGNSWTPC